MGSEERAASLMHRRCGSMCSPNCFASTSPVHRRCIADTLRPHLLRPHRGGLHLGSSALDEECIPAFS
eukprot:1339852-Pyramimonas_sp.AAC.1